MPERAPIHVLIVEDNLEKLKDVFAAVKGAAGAESQIDIVYDVHAAIVFLSRDAVDLLVIDLMLPATPEAEPTRDGGLELVEELIQRDELFKLPAHIVGLTAFDDAFDAAQDSFDLECWSLIKYDEGTSAWRDRLARKIKQIRISKTAHGERPAYDTFACVLTALESPELKSILALPWSWKENEPDDDVSIYYSADVSTPNGSRTIVASAAIRIGMAAAACLSMKMIKRFRPRYLAMCGITAGIEKECNLGDVILADPSWHWESGKHSTISDGATFAPSPHQIYIERKLRNRIDALRRNEGFFKALQTEFDGVKPAAAPQLRIGPMASGSAVLSNSSFLELIKAQHRKALAVEMEAYGVYTAAQESDSPQPQAFCIKGVSDFADAKKDDAYQAYASYSSARTFQELVEHVL